MAITVNTPANLVVGAGDLKVDNDDVGATADDNEFTINQEIFEPDNLNGQPGMLVGTQYKRREEAVLAATLPEISAAALALLWAGSSSAVDGDETTIDWDATRRLPTSAFKDYALVIPGLDGKEFQFLADSALNQGNITYAGADDNIMLPRGEFHSKWSASPSARSPHRIVFTVAGS
jgi:hypothetical protein